MASGGPWTIDLVVFTGSGFFTEVYTIELGQTPTITSLTADVQNSTGGVICTPTGAGEVTLTAEADMGGSMPPVTGYRWEFNTQADGSGPWTTVPGANGPTLVVTSTSTAGYLYRVFAENDCGESAPAQILVIERDGPTISNLMPTDEFVACEGEDAVFSANATSSTTVATAGMRWERKAAGAPDFVPVTLGGRFSEVEAANPPPTPSTSTLTVANMGIDPNDDGSLYRFRAQTASACVAFSDEIAVDVVEDDQLGVSTGILNNEIFDENETKVFLQVISGTSGDNTTIEWNIDGVPIVLTADRFAPDEESGFIPVGAGKIVTYKAYNLPDGNNVQAILELTNTPSGSQDVLNQPAFLKITTTDDNGQECMSMIVDEDLEALFSFLPIELLFFEALPDDEAVLLQWATESETDNAFFTIERSYEGTDFEELTTIGGAGTTLERQDYEYRDETVAGLSGQVYYRLKQTDFDGQYSYSPVVAVELAGTADFSVIKAFPAGSLLNVQFQNDQDREVTARIVDINGRLLTQQVLGSRRGYNEAELDVSRLAAGVYVLNLQSGQEQRSHRFVIAR